MNQLKQSSEGAALPKTIKFNCGTKANIMRSVVPEKPMNFHDWFARYIPNESKLATEVRKVNEYITK